MKAKKNLHEEAAHFILLNSEVVSKLKIKDKALLLYYLFHYAYKYRKQSYASFAFELLQETLSYVIIPLENKKIEPLSAVEIGWSLLLFIEEGFFESDDLEDILNPLDEIAISKINSLSRGKFSSDSMDELLLIAFYFFYRIRHVDEKSEYTFIIKEHLSIAFFELTYHIKDWNKRDVVWIMLMEFLFEKGLDREETVCTAKRGLLQLESDITPYKKEALELYSSARKNQKLSRALLLSHYFSEKIQEINNDKQILLKDIANQLNNNINQSNIIGDNNAHSIMKRIIIQALALIDELESKNLVVMIAVSNLNIRYNG